LISIEENHFKVEKAALKIISDIETEIAVVAFVGR
jgi:hypothetical protein